MDKPEPERGPKRGPLCIPSFATERCRAMTADLIGALDAIPPTDDQALEDRALASFVVACGELALIGNARQRDLVVEQLTIVGRKLVNAALAAASTQSVDPVTVEPPAVEPPPVVESRATKPTAFEPVVFEPEASEIASSEIAGSDIAASESAPVEPEPLEPSLVEAPVFDPSVVAEAPVGPPPVVIAATALPVTLPPPDMNLKPTEPPNLLEPHIGLTWEQMEAVLKREKAERDLGRSLI